MNKKHSKKEKHSTCCEKCKEKDIIDDVFDISTENDVDTERDVSIENKDTILKMKDLQYVEKMREEVREYKEKYLLLLAESENTRKRMQKERHDLMKFAIRDIVVDMLLPMDHFENALMFVDQMSDEVKNWAVGFKMILGQFKDVLSSHGVTSYDSHSSAFDPHYHEAIEIVETNDVEPGTILKEFAKGYKMGDEAIRPARVRVSKLPAPNNKEEEKIEKEDCHEKK